MMIMTIVNRGEFNVPLIYVQWVDVEKISDFDVWIEEQKKEVAECNEFNKVIGDARAKRVGFIGSEIKALYGEKSKMYRYWKNNHYVEMSRVPDLDATIKNLIERRNKIVEAKAKDERENTKRKEHTELIVKAVIFLQKHGYEPGTYELDDAVRFADAERFDELVAERVKEHETEGTYFEFSGQNCDDPCQGWDGDSRRCECGNRRVSWSSCGHFDDMYIYGEAY
jgi:hypothetical protein